MYEKLNITENSLHALSLFTNGFDRAYYIREVQKLLAISPRTAQLILEDLEQKGIIASTVKGKIKVYALRMHEISKRYLAFAEQYKAIVFLEKDLLIKESIEKISPHITGIGIVFGSHAKGIAKKDSDLDIFIAGRYEKGEVDKVSSLLGIDISVKCYPPQVFEKNLKKDIFLKEVLKNHIVFKGSEQFIEKVMDNG